MGIAPEIGEGGDRAGTEIVPPRLLLFRVAEREYAFPLGPVVEVGPYAAPTPVPWSDPAIEGIVPRRGRMLTVVDARIRLGLPARAAGSRAQLIVLDTGEGGYYGLTVDTVEGIAPPGAVAEAPAAGPATPYCRGLLPRGDRYVPVLDLAALLRGTP
ncbi:MAG: chemotaxis protein CheW [Candidatus Polarisedimenticolia bacterium]